jgi:hypothetical protein
VSATLVKALIFAAYATAAIIFASGLGAAPVSPRSEPLIDYAITWYREKQRLGILSVSRQECMLIFGHGMTRQILIEQAGELESYLDGANRRISTASVCRRLIALAILSHPLDGPERKARRPAGRYQKHRREPTPQELAGLQRGNAQRAEDARKRREAKVAARV